MDTPTIERETRSVREEATRLGAPAQALFRAMLFDLPLSVASETLRFFGRRLQAQGEHLASLNACRSVPEMIDANSQFMRGAMDAYGSETSKIMEDVRGTMGEIRSRFSKAA